MNKEELYQIEMDLIRSRNQLSKLFMSEELRKLWNNSKESHFLATALGNLDVAINNISKLRNL